MDNFERKLIPLIKNMDDNLEDASYCNKLTKEILQIVKLKLKTAKFKNKKYVNKNELMINIAKYYVKGAQIYSAINKNTKLMLPDLSEEDIQEISDDEKEDTTLHNIIHNYAIQVKTLRKYYKTAIAILDKLMADTFLPSLEEMNILVMDTKQLIKKINALNVLDRIELYFEKKKFDEFQEKIFSMY
jgi:hypothetical protein